MALALSCTVYTSRKEPPSRYDAVYNMAEPILKLTPGRAVVPDADLTEKLI